MAYIWLLIILLGVIIEALTVGLISIWFVFGALAALIATYFGANLWIQIIIAIAVTIISAVLTRPLVKKMLENKNVNTNSDRHIGKVAIVVNDILPILGSGEVKISGKIWSSASITGEEILINSKVIVRKIEGNKLFVEKVEE